MFGLFVNLAPRHFAAVQYTVLAVFVAASWYTMLSPWERVLGQLEFMFAPDYKNRMFFVWLAIANVLTVIVAFTFWFKRAASYPLSLLLVCVSVGLLTWSIWWSNATFIFSYTLGCILSILSWRRPNK